MKINDSTKNAPNIAGAQTPAAQGKATEKAAPAPAAAAETSVRLSLSAQMQALAGNSGSGSVFNAKKVEEIRFAIADGNFRVNSDKVADGLLATVRDMLHARQGQG